MKKAIGLLCIIVLTGLLLGACGKEDINSVDNFQGNTIDDNPSHYSITIDNLQGTKEVAYDIEKSKKLEVDIKVEGEPLGVKIEDPDGNDILDITIGEEYSGVNEGEYKEGKYKFIFTSEELKHGEVKIKFNE
ncbi:hypothetical protein [Dethiothermospora halolimnae]|uniref:hypothetical protein n=1 Tax=Dethiothermospora halolimnae TaxID=3114390 RepID=UPI003CCBA9D6